MGMSSFVGRQPELGAVCRVLTGVGPERAAVVTGEAGIGKSRLLAEATLAARKQGVVVLVGHCLPLARGIPLLPFGEALRGLAKPTGCDPVPAVDLKALLGQVLRGLPAASRTGLAVLAPGLVPGDETPELGLAAPERQESALVDDQSVLLVGLRDLLLAIASARPLALVVEDVHWADPLSRDLLTLLTHAPGMRPGVVVTMRADEPQQGERLSDWLAVAVRHPATEVVSLGPLADEDVDTLATELAGTAAATERFLTSVRARAGGNPLFAEQLVFDALSVRSPGSHRVPDRVVALLGGRLAAASAPEREVLEALAVVQRPLDQDDVARVLGVAPGELTDPIRALVRRGLVELPGDSTLRLRHALLADQIRSGQLPAEQRDWHRRVAETLADRPGVEPAEVAGHFAAAGDHGKERRWSIIAAESAERVHAWSVAAGLWARVHELSRQADTDDSRTLRPTLRRAAALEAAGQEYLAAAVAQDALANGAYVDDPRAWAELVLYRDFELDDVDLAVAELRRADAALADLPPSEERARVLRQLARRLDDRGERPAGTSCFVRALQIAQAADADAFARLLRGSLTVRAHHDGGPVGVTMTDLEGLVEEARAHAQGAVLMHLGMYLTSLLLWTEELDTTRRRGRSLLEDAARLGVGQIWAAGMVLSNTLEADVLLGRSDDARLLLDARRTGILDGSPMYPHRVNDAMVLIPEGRLLEATSVLGAVSREVIPGTDRQLTWAGLVLEAGFWAEDDPTHLVEVGTAAAEELGRRRPDYLPGLLWQISRLAAEARDDASASLSRSVCRVDGVNHPDGRRIPSAYRLMTRAEQTRQATAADPDVWLAAATSWSDLGCRHLEGYSRWRCAEALVQRRQRVGAQQQLHAAFELSAGHTPQRARIATFARHARLSCEKPSAPAAAPRGVAPFDLSDRELQILTLLTQGRSNKEIGAALFISGKTASVHVTHILRKLRVGSRVEAAAMAEREHLV
jgi:DNA-binding CsgD family transcriptional regulator